MRRILVLLVLCAAAAGAAAAREPSESCGSGEVPPGTTPAGVGVRQAGDPYQEPTSLYACGSRAPAKGHAWVRADAEERRLHVIADGDSDNGTRVRCADGYAAARAGTDGARLYRSDDGDFSFVAGDQSPEAFVRGAVAGCTSGPRPALQD